MEPSRGWTRDLLKVAGNPRTTRRVEEAEFFQARAETRFAETYRLARVLQRKARNLASEGSSGRVSRPKRDRINNNIEAAFFDGTAAIDSIARLLLENAHRWYEDSDGEPGPIQSPASAMFTEGYPQKVGDSNKVLRAAAFAGWVIAPNFAFSNDEVGELISRYTSLK